MARVTLQILDMWKPGVVGLLIPVPPDTPTQKLRGMGLPSTWDPISLESVGHPQRALFLRPGAGLSQAITFEIEQGRFSPDMDAYGIRINRYTELPEKVMDAFSSGSGRDLVAQAANYVFSRMDYRNYSSDASGKDFIPSVVCDLESGNCLDMHTLFLAILQRLHIPSAYTIGHFFPASGNGQVDGWHCWVGVVDGGIYQDWDISHGVIAKTGSAKPGLNAIPGKRVAMSRGRGLAFRLGGIQVDLSHFGVPKWVAADGSTTPARIAAAWEE